MTITFKITGGYKIPTCNKGNICIDKNKLDKFWNDNNMRDKKGIYIFAIRRGKGGILPYYVGKTKVCFEKECFTPHKIEKYVNILGKTGTPLMYFVYTDTNKKSVSKVIKTLEKEMISWAYIRNPDILNEKEKQPEWAIEGITTKTLGANTKIQNEFKKMIGID